MKTAIVRRTSDPLHKILDDLLRLMEDLDAAPPDQQAAVSVPLTKRMNALCRKADSIHGVLTRFESNAGECASEIKRLQARKKAMETAAARLEGHVLDAMVTRNIKAMRGDTVTLTAKLNPGAVRITDELAVPPEYSRVTVTMPAPLWFSLCEHIDPSAPDLGYSIAPSKSLISAAIDAGNEVPGAIKRQGLTLSRK